MQEDNAIDVDSQMVDRTVGPAIPSIYATTLRKASEMRGEDEWTRLVCWAGFTFSKRTTEEIIRWMRYVFGSILTRLEVSRGCEVDPRFGVEGENGRSVEHEIQNGPVFHVSVNVFDLMYCRHSHYRWEIPDDHVK